jgi:hypothetical protein
MQWAVQLRSPLPLPALRHFHATAAACPPTLPLPIAAHLCGPHPDNTSLELLRPTAFSQIHAPFFALSGSPPSVLETCPASKKSRTQGLATLSAALATHRS